MRKVKPLNDFIFKKVFGEKGNEDILISFINAVLKRTKKEPIVEIEIIDNKQLNKALILDKTGIIDVRAKTSKGENIDIEVQLTDQGNMDKRTLFYWGKMYLENIKQGQDYTSLEKVITINILDFNFLGTESYQSSFHLWEDIEKDYMLTDVVEIHFLELPKFRNKKDKDYRENDIERWLMFLEKDIPETTLKELMSLDTAIEKAEQKIEYLSSDEESMRIYYERERSLHERANMISSAEERKAIEIAKNLLDILDDKIIAAKTGLDIEEVKSLRVKNP
ncbi:Rpn family recombination-promoting nuclease/putative transposase [Clostridium botulinum]|uniref:Rpn family recombination-promoting nuclease/putative transposase n=1 Tax=Clostridium botulinum TaxID=1491 RepID=UPI000773ADD7|nr:Rpn family recombination-promoting nuclease/putative transposase [Clostridium botulinum]NFE93564.1 Rpn family recombination-promoting nuclease/putative transposase [Clostridium botulinum]NFL38125.1 Rpn family recombination-promoting nuclease/putative transposase [Clostridium botulinum]NFL64387.1 Rpn family recombination-promoting nuclease/putative transposase [Clostridium botulinum]NFN07934.1 Rpn family recombination-promoting nuclease/putative transposase [Clostridium botulinum]NFN24161.1 